MATITTKFVKATFFNQSNGYTTQVVKCLDCEKGKQDKYKNKNVTLVGFHLPVYKEISYEMTGEWVIHPKYGEQFEVQSYKEIVQKSKDAIISYLSSGIIKGVGEKTALKIYEKFGDDTLEILDMNIRRLKEVKGISSEKIKQIENSYFEARHAMKIMELLSPYGFTVKAGMLLYTKFQTKAIDIIQNNPYRMCEVPGFTFEDVDEYVRKTGGDLLCKQRVIAAIKSTIKSYMLGGSSAIPKELLFSQLQQTLSNPPVPHDTIFEASREAQLKCEVIVEKIKLRDGLEEILVYLANVSRKETMLAKKIFNMSSILRKVICTDADVDEAERALKVKLHTHQRLAVIEALNNGVCVITGGPGTGKTTVLKTLCWIYKQKTKGNWIELLSPTGKAARRMEESTHLSASTIHSALRIGIEDEDSEGNRYDDEPFEPNFVVVDESSMADLNIATHLFEAVPEDSQVVLVGDIDQLPSVGAGNVLSDLIDSGIVPVVVLTHVYRQAVGSEIAYNAQRVKVGNTNIVEQAEDYHHIEISDMRQAADTIVRLYVEKTKQYKLGNVACLVPMRKTDVGVYELNRRIQAIINPFTHENEEIKHMGGVLRTGDLVMQLDNIGEVSNGDIGVVQSVGVTSDTRERIATIRFTCIKNGHKDLIYKGKALSELTLAYAMTVHKSQGSEYPCVITCFMMCHKSSDRSLQSGNGFNMLFRKLFYTAITRGQEEVITVGQREAIKKAIETESPAIRYTHLTEKLVYFKQKFERGISIFGKETYERKAV